MAIVEDLMARGYRTRVVVTRCGDEYGMRPRTVWAYIRAIRKEWAINANAPMDERRHTLVARLEWAYRMACEDGAYVKAAQIAVRIGEAHGLMGPGVVDAPSATNNVVVVIGEGQDGKATMKQLNAQARREREAIEG